MTTTLQPCVYVLTRGPRKGIVCNKKTKISNLCHQHREKLVDSDPPPVIPKISKIKKKQLKERVEEINRKTFSNKISNMEVTKEIVNEDKK